MSDSYFFDKRKLKRGFTKYGIIFLISFLPLVLFNIFVGSLISADWVVVFLDCVILLIFVCIGNSIANRIYEKKDAKRNARIRAREELNERKKQILEDSYKKKRQRKLEEKASSNNESEKIEKEELSNTEVKVEENNSVDKPKKTQVKNKKTKEKVVDEKE